MPDADSIFLFLQPAFPLKRLEPETSLNIRSGDGNNAVRNQCRCEIPASREGGLPWSPVARSLHCLPVGRAVEALPLLRGTHGFSKVRASRGLPASAWKSLTPTSSEILVWLVGTQ